MTKSLVQSQFAKSAKSYVKSKVHAKGESLARLVELTKPQRDWRVLDIATGAGHTALAFAPHVDTVVASDLTPEMLKVARELAEERGLGNVTFQDADAEALPFADETFDLVTCRIAPHHFPHPEKFVAEAARVLKHGAIFGLVDNISPDSEILPEFSTEDLEAAAADYNMFEKLRDEGHARALTLTEWQRLLGEAGFTLAHSELLTKDMNFEIWASRMHIGETVKADLRNRLENAAPALAAFLRPKEGAGGLAFSLTEALLIGRKAN